MVCTVHIAMEFDTSYFEKLDYIPKTLAYETYQIRSVFTVKIKQQIFFILCY